MSQENLPTRKYDKGNVIQSRYGDLLKVNSYYYSPFRKDWAYFGSYIDRRTGKVIAHNDRTVGTGQSEYPTKVADSLKQWRKSHLPKGSIGVEEMERTQ